MHRRDRSGACHAELAFTGVDSLLCGRPDRLLLSSGQVGDALLAGNVQRLADGLSRAGIRRIASRLDNGLEWMTLDLAVQAGRRSRPHPHILLGTTDTTRARRQWRSRRDLHHELVWPPWPEALQRRYRVSNRFCGDCRSHPSRTCRPVRLA
jgi:hypothetical protein